MTTTHTTKRTLMLPRRFSVDHELRADQLSVGYDRRPVINGLDVQIPTGRVTVIVGANACGKSTLLRALARLLRPSAGTVVLDGRICTAPPPRRSPR